MRDVQNAQWSVEYYKTESGDPVGSAWLDDLDEPHRAAWIAFVDVLLIPFGKDIPYRNWVKALGDGLFELRIDQPKESLRTIFEPSKPSEHSEPAAILLRAFCTFAGQRIVIVFGGYDKRADPSTKRQQRAIKRARRFLKAWRQETRSG